MKKLAVILISMLMISIFYLVFFNINWKLIETGDVLKIEKHLKHKMKISLNSTNKEGYALFNVVLKNTSNQENYSLINFLLEKDLKKKKMISPYESIVEGFGELDSEKLLKLEKLGELLKKYGFTNFEADRSLLKALEIKNYDLFEILLKIGVNPNQKNDLGETAIFYTIKNQYKYENELFKVMERFGLEELPNKNGLANLFRSDKKGKNTTELLIVKKAMEFYEEPLKVLKLLDKYGADPNIADNKEVMPIAYCFEKGNKIYFKRLLKFKTPVNFKAYGNYKVIFDGIKNGNAIVLNEIYKKKLDLYQKNEKNETLLNFIIREEKFYILENLIEKKLLSEEHKDYIFNYYVETEDLKTLKKLNSLNLYLKNPQKTFEEKIKRYQKIDILVYLIDLKVDINIGDKNGDTPLIYAVKVNDNVLFKLLNLRKANSSIQNNDGNTALIIAVKNKNEKFVAELINNGAKIGIKNNLGEDASFFAKGQENLSNLLGNKGQKY